MRKLYAFLFTAFALLVSAANQASAQNYTFTTTAGNAIVPGTTLVPGSQADDVTIVVALPFSYSAYGTSYASVRVSTNGNIQFTTANASFTNVCPLPVAGFGVTFHAFWDDLILVAAGQGIFTSVSGVAPNRIFNIEWRSQTFSGGAPANFEIRLFEGRQRVDYIYATTPDGSSASIGVQSLPTLQTTFSCNAASVSSGLRVSFVLVPPNDLCSGAIPINCSQTITGTTADATIDAVPSPCGTSFNTAPGVWYTFLGDGGTVTLSLCGSAYDSKIGVFSGSCGSLVCVTGNDDFCGLQSQVTFATVSGITYNIIVTGFGTATGAFTLVRSGVCVPPCSGVPSPGLITGPSGTLCGGTPVTLTLSGYSAGSGLTFQWKSSSVTGGPYTSIPGAISPAYSFSTVSTQYYIVTVTCTISGFSSNTSEFAVNVSTLAHINVLATPASVCAPGATVITGTATGGTVGANVILVASPTINLAIPDNTTVTTTLTAPARSIATFNDLKLRLNIRHSWVGDVRISLTSPCGTTILFDRPGVPATTFGNADNLGTSNAATPPPAVYLFDVAGATIIPEVSVPAGFIPAGTYKPSDAGNPGAAHNWAGLTFPCATAGVWTLSISDLVGGDVGNLVDWSILFNANYTHVLTGPGTITQNPPTGTFNANASFNVSGLPAGNQVMTLTTTDGVGCTFSTPVTVTVNPLPLITISPAAPVICAGAIQPLTAIVTIPGQNYSMTTSTGNSIVPGTTLVAGSQGDDVTAPIALPFPYSAYGTVYNSVNASSNGNLQFTTNNAAFTNTCPLPNATMGVAFHPHWDDLWTNPPAGAFGVYTSVSGVAPNRIFNIEWRAQYFPGVNTANFEARLFEGQQRVDFIYGTVTNLGVSASIGVQSQPTAQATTFTCNTGGLSSGLGISYVLPSLPAIFSPVTELYTDAGATIAYTGTPVTTIYAKPTVTRTYTATATSAAGCVSSPAATVVVTVNQLPAITGQPTALAAPICPGFNVTYTVTATGAGLTYQWRRNGVNLVNGPLINLSTISGATTNSLTITNTGAANAGNYDVVVSGTCTPPVTSNAVALVVASAPIISTQPANLTVCANTNAVFTVATVGSIPAPTIYQWQVSTDGGVTWTNLVTGGSFTPTLTLAAAATTLSGNRYRVIVTNFCGQSITSNAVTLTVNPIPVVVATDLFNRRICISDTLVPLVATPTGGVWTGIGVSGSNFVPPVTAIGTFVLTYTYTNSFGCTISDTTSVKVVDCPERLRELTDEGAVTIFPNPSNGRFNIRLNSTLYNYLGIKTYDMNGRLMVGNAVTNPATDRETLVTPTYTGLYYGRTIPIDLSHLAAGTYLLVIYYDDGVRTSKKGFMIVIMK